MNDLDRKREILKFCQALFATSNLIGTDFDDMQIIETIGRHFPQQANGAGLHVCFSVSWHAVGKTGKDAHDALDTLGVADD